MNDALDAAAINRQWGRRLRLPLLGVVVALGLALLNVAVAMAAAQISIAPNQGTTNTLVTVRNEGKFNCAVPGTLYIFFGQPGQSLVYEGTLQDQVGATLQFTVPTISQVQAGTWQVRANCRGIASEGPQVEVPFTVTAAPAQQPATGGSGSITVLQADANGQPQGQNELKSAQPGAAFAVEGGDFPSSCPTLVLRFDSQVLGTVDLGPGGSFQKGGFHVPQGSGGAHAVTAACTTAPSVVLASYAVQLSGGGGGTTAPPPQPAGGTVEQTPFAQSLRAANQVPTSPIDILRSVLLAAVLMALIAFPAELFNSTLQEHYDEVKGWFGFAAGAGTRFAALGHVLGNRAVSIAAVIVVSAALYGFLDPTFGLNLTSLAFFIGIAGAIALGTFSYALTSGYFIRIRHGHRGTLRVFPGALVVALVCVVISRIANFLPGYLFALMAAFQLGPEVELPKEHQGRAQAVAAAWLLAVSVAAWLIWIPVKAAAGGVNPSFFIVLLSALLAGTFVAGIEGVLFGLLPLRFMDGEKVMAWRRLAWAALFGVAAVLFVHVLLNPAVGYVSGQKNIVTALILFGGFGAVSVGFWSYFRFRGEPADATGESAAG